MHIAETEAQARADVEFGLAQWVDYFERVAALPLAPGTLDPDKMVDALMETGFAVVGTPEMAIAQIERLIEQSGGFGTYLLMAHEWADREATLRSYELFAREVMPHFKGRSVRWRDSRDWAAENRPEFIGAVGGAIMQAISDHHAEREAKQEQVRTKSRSAPGPARAGGGLGAQDGRASKVGTRCRAARASSTRRTGVRCGASVAARRALGRGGLGRDALEGAGQGLEGLQALGLGGLDHERLVDDQREVDGRRVESLLEQALGDVEGLHARALLERRGRQDALVHAGAVVGGVEGCPTAACAASWR